MAVYFRLAVSRLLVPMQAVNTFYSRQVHLPNTASCSQTIYRPTDGHLRQLSGYFCRQPVASFTTDTKSRKKRWDFYLCDLYCYCSIYSIKVTFTDRDGDEYTVDAKLGDSLLEVAKEYDIDLEGIWHYHNYSLLSVCLSGDIIITVSTELVTGRHFS